MTTMTDTTTTPKQWRNLRFEVLKSVEDLPSLSTVVVEFLAMASAEFVSAKDFEAMGFGVWATGGTADYLAEKGVNVTKVNKVHEGQRPHVLDHIKNGEIDLVINTPSGKKTVGDAKMIRQNTLLYDIPYTTTVSGARAIAQAITELKETGLKVESLQKYYGA